MVRSGGASRCSGGGRSIVFLVQGSQEVANVCSAGHPQGRQPQSWSRRHGGIEDASTTLSVSKADPLSFRLVMVVQRSMEYVKPGIASRRVVMPADEDQ